MKHLRNLFFERAIRLWRRASREVTHKNLASRQARRLYFYIILFAFIFTGCAKSGVNTPRQHASTSISQERIYFSFASDYILPEAVAGISGNIDWLQANSSAYIILEGHCDEVGDKEFNMELGDRRARVVKAYMIEHGIPAERIIMVVSYGSTRPLNPGHRIEDLRENRRVEFVIR